MKILLTLLLAVVLVAGCGGEDSADELSTDFASSPTGRIKYNHQHDGQGIRELVLQYHGHPLYCLDQKRGDSQYAFGGISCDWVRYHEEVGNR